MAFLNIMSLRSRGPWCQDSAHQYLTEIEQKPYSDPQRAKELGAAGCTAAEEGWGARPASRAVGFLGMFVLGFRVYKV